MGGGKKRVQKRVNSLERNESEISNKRFLHLLQGNITFSDIFHDIF